MARVVAKPQAPVRRWRVKRWLLLAAVVLLVWFAPALVAHSPLRNWLLGRALARLGTAECGGASLGWLVPIVLRDVTVRDVSGQTVLSVPKFTSDRTLLGLLFDRANLGTFRLEQPLLEARFIGDSSNLEKLAQPMLAPAPGTERGEARSFVLEINDGRIRWIDDDHKAQWQLQPMNGSIKLAPGTREPATISLRAVVAGNNAAPGNEPAPGKLEIDVTAVREGGETNAEAKIKGEAKITLAQLPSQMLNPLLRRFEPGAQLAGRVQGQWSHRWTHSSDGVSSQGEGRLDAADITLAGPWRGGEHLRLKKVAFPCRLATVDRRLHIAQAELSCDLGKVSLRGGIDLDKNLAGWLEEPGWSLAVEADLAQLANQLPQTIQLRPGTRCTDGRLSLSCESLARADGAAWEGNLTTTALRGVRNGQPLVWPEPLTLDFRVRRHKHIQIDHLRCESRFLRVAGSGTLDDFSLQADLDLEKLAEPVSQFVDLGPWRPSGQGKAQLTLRVSAKDQVQLSAAANIQNLRLGPVLEPSFELRAAGVWRRDQDRLGFTEVFVKCHTLTAHSVNLQIHAPPDRALGVTGKATVQGDVGRLRNWLRDPAQPPEPLSGTFIGQVEWLPAGDRLQGQIDVTCSDLIVGPPASPTWREPRLRAISQLRYIQAADQLLIDKLQIDASALACSAVGKIDALGGRQHLELAGKLHYDLQKLEPMLRPYLGQDVKAVGKDSRPFRLSGPLAGPDAGVQLAVKSQPLGTLDQLSGDAALHWNSLRAYGADLGPAELRASLKQGWLHLVPIDTTLNGGKLKLEPWLRLSPLEARLAKGSIIDKAHLTPAMCAGALAYALPPLANVAKAEGHLSLELDGAQVFPNDLGKSNVLGRITLHGAHVAPSPLIVELGQLLKATPPTVRVKEQPIVFHFAEGKVHHRDLELMFPDLSVRTSGWVGLDGTLKLLAEMPVPPRWLPQGRLGTALAKQTVRLPLTGTLDRPRLDQAAVRAALADLARQTAGTAIEKEFQDRLKKIFGPK